MPSGGSRHREPGSSRRGLTTRDRGFLAVDEHFQTEVPKIYAVGDVIGWPMLASVGKIRDASPPAMPSAIERSHRVEPSAALRHLYHTGNIHCRENGGSLTAKNIPYEIGHAFYREVARGQIIAEPDGMVKLLFHRQSLQLLGVHIIGSGASELIHIGQVVLSFGGLITYFINSVFNYPTLSEAYKIAALNGINRLG